MFTDQPKTAEEFITARRTQPKWIIAFSFYASAIGAWVMSGPATYAFYSGIVGAVMYGVAAGIPIIMIALFGDTIRNWYPNVLSLSDYAKLRFGMVTQVFVVFVSCLNMSIAAIAELTTIASLFGNYA
eukprot:Pgem_evm1s4767